MISMIVPLLLLMGTSAFGETTHVYSGTIAKKLKVVVELEVAGEHLTGKYFYVSKALDLALQGDLLGKQWHLSERDDETASGNWTLEAAGGGFTGTWTAPGGKKGQPIALTPSADSFATLQANARFAIDPCLVDWSSREGLHALKGLPSDHPTRCNSSGCRDKNANPEWHMDEHRSMKPTAHRFLEVQYSVEGYCGGAYPNAGDTETNQLDMDSGEFIHLNDLFADFDNNSEAIEKLFHRDQAAMTALHQSKEDASWVEDCEHFTDAGFSIDTAARTLVLHGNYPHVSAVCYRMPELTAPIAKLKPLLSDYGRTYFDAILGTHRW